MNESGLWWEDAARAESRVGVYDGPDDPPPRDEWEDPYPKRYPVLPDSHWPDEPPFGETK